MSVNDLKRRVLDDSSSDSSSSSSSDDASDVETRVSAVHPAVVTAPAAPVNSIRIGNSKTKSKAKQDTVVASRIPNSTQPPAIWLPRDFQQWSEERKRSWRSLPKNPSAYYYRFSPPHVARIDTPWTDAERKKFQELHECRFSKDWGYFSMNQPGRTGQMCEQFYKQILDEKRTGVKAGKVMPHLPQEYNSNNASTTSNTSNNNTAVEVSTQLKTGIPTSVTAVATTPVVKKLQPTEISRNTSNNNNNNTSTVSIPKGVTVPPTFLATNGSTKVTVNKVEMTKQQAPIKPIVKVDKRAVFDTPASRTSKSLPGAPFVNRSRSRVEEGMQGTNLHESLTAVNLTVKAVPITEEYKIQPIPFLERNDSASSSHSSENEQQQPELPQPKTPVRQSMKAPKSLKLPSLPPLPEPNCILEENKNVNVMHEHSVFTAKPSSRGNMAFVPSTGYNPYRFAVPSKPDPMTYNGVRSYPASTYMVSVDMVNPMNQNELMTVDTVHDRSSSTAQVAMLRSHHNMQTHRLNTQLVEHKYREALIDELVEQNEQVNQVWKRRKLELGKEATRTTRSQNDVTATVKEEDNPIYQFDIDDTLNHRKPTTLTDYTYKLYSQFDPHKYSVDPVHSNNIQAKYIYSTRTAHVKTVVPPRHINTNNTHRFPGKPKLDMWKNLSAAGIPTSKCPQIKPLHTNTETTQKFSEYIHLQTDGIVFGTAYNAVVGLHDKKLIK